MSITHSFISGKSDGGDATLVRPSDWNADHVGGLDNPMTDEGDLIIGGGGSTFADLLAGLSGSGVGATVLSTNAGAGGWQSGWTDGTPTTGTGGPTWGSGAWIRADFGSAKDIRRFRMTTDGWENNGPKTDLFLESSPNNSTWTTRWQMSVDGPTWTNPSGASGWAFNTAGSGPGGQGGYMETGLIELPSVVSAQYWRVRGTGPGGGNPWGIGTVELYEETGIPGGVPERLAIGDPDDVLTVDPSTLRPSWRSLPTTADILDIPTSETDSDLVLKPDGAGGVAWGVDSGGSGGGGGGGEYADKYNPDHETPATTPAFAEEFNGSKDAGWAWTSAPGTDDLSNYPGFYRIAGDSTERHLSHAWTPGATDVTLAAKFRQAGPGDGGNIAIYLGDTTGNPNNLVMVIMTPSTGVVDMYTENGAGSFSLIGSTGVIGQALRGGDFYLRLTRLNSGPTWRAYASTDGITWYEVSATTNKSLTIAALGIRIDNTSDYAVDWIRAWDSIVEKVGGNGGGGGGSMWTQVLNESGASFANFTAGSGTWASASGVISQTAGPTGAHYRARFNDPVILGMPIIYEGEIRLDSVGGGDAFAYLLVGYDGSTGGGGLAVGLDPNDDVVRVEHSAVAIVREKAAGTVVTGTWYKLRLLFNGPWVSIYLNDVWLCNAAFTVSSANADSIGLNTYNATASFRNLKAWTLDFSGI